MEFKCPGRINNAPKDTMIIACPSCGHEIEMFEDEAKVRCHCGQTVFQKVLPSCAKWCSAAAQCLGLVDDVAGKMQRAEATTDQKEQERRLAELREQIRRSTEKCAEVADEK